MKEEKRRNDEKGRRKKKRRRNDEKGRKMEEKQKAIEHSMRKKLECKSKREKDKDSSFRATHDFDDIIFTKDDSINKVDPSKIWPDSCQISDIVRLKSRDGFWDLPSSFIASKFN